MATRRLRKLEFPLIVRLVTPFAPGAEVSGPINIRGYEHVTMTILIETMEPDRFFSFRWHPYAIEPGVDYSAEPTTLVSHVASRRSP